MLRNYLKTALRNLWRFKGYTLINILGLAIGIACVLLITLYVRSELSYDNFHTNKDRIHRLNIEVTVPQSGAVRTRSIGPYRMAKEMAVDFPEFELVRIAPQGGQLIEYRDQQYSEENFGFADPNVFQVFDFKLLRGNPATALEDPFSIVMTEAIAQKYFGSQEAIGQKVTLRDREFEVTGIIAEIPENSQFEYNILASMRCGEQVFSRIVLENWGEGYVSTFAMLPEGKVAADYTTRLAQFVEVKLEAWEALSPRIMMQPLPEMYLHSKDIAAFESGGDITYVYAFSFIALFILIIACINFMNLATARSSLRAREVGLRKTVGAYRSQLIGQFLSESTVLALLSLVLGTGIAFLAMPFFNQLSGKEMGIAALLRGPMLAVMLGITFFVGIAAGSYPAIVLSGYRPVQVLSGNLMSRFKGMTLRRVLVTFQFATSIFLLAITAIVYKQLQFCKNADLGYDREHVVVFGTTLDMRAQYDIFRAELLSNPQVVNAAASSRVPPGRLSSSINARPEGVPEDQRKGMQTVWTDFDFIETMGLEIAAGRSFSRDFTADAREGFILNEAAVKDIGWTNESALGKTFGSSEITDWDIGQWVERDGKVIGVLKDFHFESMRDQIVPTVYFVAPYMAWNYVVRLRPENIAKTVAFIEQKWSEFNPGIPFDYTFVDENFATLYTIEERQAKIFGVFAILAIFIACLGLVGLASFTAERKKKEVGIRKVLGASSMNLVVLLSKEFTLLVLLAFLVAAPLSWYIMQGWLADFVYQTAVGVVVFLGAGMVALLIAWLTVAYQTGRAAYRNPVEALQYE